MAKHKAPGYASMMALREPLLRYHISMCVYVCTFYSYKGHKKKKYQGLLFLFFFALRGHMDIPENETERDKHSFTSHSF